MTPGIAGGADAVGHAETRPACPSTRAGPGCDAFSDDGDRRRRPPSRRPAEPRESPARSPSPISTTTVAESGASAVEQRRLGRRRVTAHDDASRGRSRGASPECRPARARRSPSSRPAPPRTACPPPRAPAPLPRRGRTRTDRRPSGAPRAARAARRQSAARVHLVLRQRLRRRRAGPPTPAAPAAPADDGRRHQTVVEDEVRRPQAVDRPHRQQPGIARAGARRARRIPPRASPRVDPRGRHDSSPRARPAAAQRAAVARRWPRPVAAAVAPSARRSRASCASARRPVSNHASAPRRPAAAHRALRAAGPPGRAPGRSVEIAMVAPLAPHDTAEIGGGVRRIVHGVDEHVARAPAARATAALTSGVAAATTSHAPSRSDVCEGPLVESRRRAAGWRRHTSGATTVMAAPVGARASSLLGATGTAAHDQHGPPGQLQKDRQQRARQQLTALRPRTTAPEKQKPANRWPIRGLRELVADLTFRSLPHATGTPHGRGQEQQQARSDTFRRR